MKKTKYYNLQTKINYDLKEKLEKKASQEGFKSVPDMINFLSTQIIVNDLSMRDILNQEIISPKKFQYHLNVTKQAEKDLEEGNIYTASSVQEFMDIVKDENAKTDKQKRNQNH